MGVLTTILKFLGPAVLDWAEGFYMTLSRDRALKKLGYKEAKEDGLNKKKKVLKKVDQKRVKLRTDPDYADRMRGKYTLRRKNHN